MKEGTFKHFIYLHGYLLITSAWLFTLSFVISNYWSYTSSERAVTRSLEAYIQASEHKIGDLAADRTLLDRLYSGAYSPEDLARVSSQPPYYVFLYPIFNASAAQPVFWNTNIVIPDEAILAGHYGSNYVELPNGRYVSMKREIIFKDGHTALLIALIPVQWNLIRVNALQENSFRCKPWVE